MIDTANVLYVEYYNRVKPIPQWLSLIPPDIRVIKPEFDESESTCFLNIGAFEEHIKGLNDCSFYLVTVRAMPKNVLPSSILLTGKTLRANGRVSGKVRETLKHWKQQEKIHTLAT